MKSTWKYPLAALLLAVATLGGCALVDDGPVSLEGGMTEQELLEAYADSVVASMGTGPEGLDAVQKAVWHSIVYPGTDTWSTPRRVSRENLSPESIAAHKRETGVSLK